MTFQELEQLTLKLQGELQELRNIYNKDRFSNLEIKNKKIQFNNDIGFYGGEPIDQPETISDPTTPGAVYSQAEAQSAVDAIVAIIDRLQELKLIK